LVKDVKESKENIFNYFQKPSEENILAKKEFVPVGAIDSKKQFLDSLYTKIVKIRSSLIDSECDCPTWFCKGYCPHLLACLAYENIIKIPEILERKKGRGRPKKIKGAERRNEELKKSKGKKKAGKSRSNQEPDKKGHKKKT